MIEFFGTFLRGAGWGVLPFLFLPVFQIILKKNKILVSFSHALIRTVDSFNYALGEMTKWLLPLLVLSVAISVFALSIFGLSWTKLFESAIYFHAIIIMLGAATTLLAGQHVRVDVFHCRMSPQSKALVDFCGFYLLLLPVCLVILWNSQSFIGFSWQIFEGSAEADGIKGLFLLKTLVPVFAILMMMQGTAIALRAALCLRSIAEPARPPNTPPFFDDINTEPGL